ncbi:MAG: hypothetical protein ACRCTA_00970, partial [Bacilli bacterium]
SKKASDKIEGAKIKVYLWEPLGSPEGFKKIKDAVEKYTKETYKYDVEIIFFFDNDYEEKTNNILNAGEKWDIVINSNANGTNPYAKNASDGVYLDLTPYLDTTLKDTKAILGDDIIKNTSYNGKPYAIKTALNTAFTSVILYDDDVLKKAGINFDQFKDLNSLKDLEPELKKIVEYNAANPTDQVLGIVGADRLSRGYSEYDFVIGLPFLLVGVPSAGGDAVSFLETDYFKTFGKDWNEFFTKKYTAWDPNNPFSCQRVNFGFWPANGQSDAATSDAEFSRTCNKNIKTAYFKNTVVDTTASMADVIFAVNSNSEYPAAATDFINRLFTDEYIANTLQYGIEGEHWNFSDKDAKIVERVPEKGDEYFGEYWWAEGGNYQTLYRLKGTENYKVFGEPTTRYENRVQHESLGFFFDPASVQNEVAATATVLEKYKHVTRGLPDNWDKDYEKMI